MADQFSYPANFNEGPLALTQYCRDTLREMGCDTVQLTYFQRDLWMKSIAGLTFPRTSLENIIYRSVVQEAHFIEITDVLNHQSLKFIALKSGLPLIRYISAMPVFTSCKIVTGAITLIDGKRNMLSPRQIEVLETFSASVSREIESTFRYQH